MHLGPRLEQLQIRLPSGLPAGIPVRVPVRLRDPVATPEARRAAMRDLRAAGERVVLSRLLQLPESVQRRIAGPPVVRDGLTLDLETQLVLRMLQLTRETPVENLPIPQGRVALERQSALVAGDQPIGFVEDRRLGDLPARVYVPRARVSSSRPLPTLLFIHGGGFIYGGLASHDGLCRFLAEQAGVQVLAVDYRLAPEATFPAAYDDCVAAYRYVVEHAPELSVDPERLGVGGDSAGGNLAAGVAIQVAEAGLPLRYQLLIYPTTDALGRAESRTTFAEGFYLTKSFIDLAVDSYLPRMVERSDPRASPLFADLPAGLAPAHVVTAGFDPLRDEGEAYADRLAAAGVSVTSKRYDALIHGFANWVGVGTSGRAAVKEIAGRLRSGLV